MLGGVVEGGLERLDRRVDAAPPRLVDNPTVALAELLRLLDLLQEAGCQRGCKDRRELDGRRGTGAEGRERYEQRTDGHRRHSAARPRSSKGHDRKAEMPLRLASQLSLHVSYTGGLLLGWTCFS